MTHKKKEDDFRLDSFTANYKHQNDTQYPYMLACSLARANDQFEQTRAMKMLGEWVPEYDKLSEIMKYKYAHYIPKIQKILLMKYQIKAPIQFCLGRFLCAFYNTWKDISEAMVSDLQKGDSYTLQLLWYTCHNLVEELNFQKQVYFLEFLTTKFERPLRYYEAQSYDEAVKIIDTAYLMNIYGCRESFSKNSKLWANKFCMIQKATQGDFRITVLMQIIRNTNILHSGEESKALWSQKVKLFILMLEQKVGIMHKNSIIDRQLLDLFIWLLDIDEMKFILIQGQGRYLKTILTGMRPNNNNPDHIFHLPKYKQIVLILYNLIFRTNQSQTQGKLKQILDKFNTHTFSVLSDEANYAFLDCLCQQKIQLEPSVINDMIKILGSGHIRRTMPAKILIVLAKTIAASIQGRQLADQLINQCLKYFYEALGWKMNDPLVGDLRIILCKLFLTIMKPNQWQDQFKNDSIIGVCQQTERNSNDTNPLVIQMLYLLIKKFGFCNESKLQSLIPDIFYKVCQKEEFMRPFISLLVTIALHVQFPKAKMFIQEMCLRNPSAISSFYLFQSQALLKFGQSTTGQQQTVLNLFTSRDYWEDSCIEVNLMMIEIFFLQLTPEQALSKLMMIDNYMLNLVKSLYQELNYNLLSLICAKVLGSVGGDPADLQKLQTYMWIRKYAFQILARSFYKTTSINVCYIFSMIILRAEKPGVIIKWLALEQFLEYLYQGLNDFLSKEKNFTLEVCSSLLVFKLFKTYPNLIPSSSKISQFSTLFKNVGWWQQIKYSIEFVPLKNDESNNKWILPQFKVYYEQNLNHFFRDYFKNHEQKMTRVKQIQRVAQQQDD